MSVGPIGLKDFYPLNDWKIIDDPSKFTNGKNQYIQDQSSTLQNFASPSNVLVLQK